MTPHTPTVWVLFVSMWLAGPITGYTVANLFSAAWERRPIAVREKVTTGLFGGVPAITTLLLMLVEGL